MENERQKAKGEIEDERTTLLTPRLRRTAVITAIVAFLLVSLVLGVELLFLITFSLILLLVLAYLFAHWMLRPLELKVISSPEVVERQEANLRFKLVNKGRLPRYLVEVKVQLPQGMEALDLPHLVFGQVLPRQSAEASLRVRFHKRGLHTVGQAQLWGQDPLGLFIVKKSVTAQEKVLVYPCPKPLTLLPQGAEQALRWDETKSVVFLSSSSGDEIWGVRPYQPGDELRRIHWKVTAHKGELSVLETLPYLQHGAVLLLDRHPVSHRPVKGNDETTLDDLVRYAAFLIRRWVKSGWQVVFWAPPEPPVMVGQEWQPVWRQLALLQPEPFHLTDLQPVGHGVILTTPFSPLPSVFRHAALFGWSLWAMPVQGGEQR